MGRIVKDIVNRITRCDWMKWRELMQVLCDKKVMVKVKTIIQNCREASR